MKNSPAGHLLDAPTAGRVRRLRRWLGFRADPPPRPIPVRRLRAVRRPWPLAVWQARSAVLARTTLDEYLRSRLARYLLHLAVPRSQLPVRIEVVGGEILAVRRHDPPPPPASADADAWAAPLVALEGTSVLREAPELRARIASLENGGAAARRRVDELSRQLAEDMAAGRLPPDPRPEDGPEQLGRPPVRSPGRQLGMVAVAVAAVLAEAWAIAVPALSAAGHYPIVLDGELGTDTLQAALTCTFALGLALGLLALALVSLRSAEAFGRAVAAPRQRRGRGAALLAGMAAAWAAAAAATIPAPRSGLPPASHALLLLSVTAGAALMLRRAGRERDERSAELTAALVWDRDRARALGERARRLEELTWAEAALREIGRLQRRAWARMDELVERSAAAARILAQAEQTERADRARLAQSLRAALERDRYEFLRQATVRGAADLLSGPWRPPAEPRSPVADEAPARESGRMAG